MKRRRLLDTAAAVTVTGLVASFVVFSIVADGATAVTLAAHDDGAWLLDQAAGTVVHVNGAGQQQDSNPVPIGAPDRASVDGFVLVQHGEVAAALDSSNGRLSFIDPATRKLRDKGQTVLEEGVDIVASETGLVLLHPDGRIARLAASAPLPDTLPDDAWEPGPGPDLVAATAIDGTVWIYSRSTGALWYLGDRRTERFAVTPLSDAQLTVVGDMPVLLGDDGDTLIVGDTTERRLVGLGLGADAVLQVPSAEGSSVLVAAEGDVKAISLTDGTITVRIDELGDDPVAPAMFGSCAHGFSQQSGVWKRSCGAGAIAERPLPPGPASFRLVNDRLWLDSLQGGVDWFMSNEYEPTEVAKIETEQGDDRGDTTSDSAVDDAEPDATAGGGTEAGFEVIPVVDGNAPPSAADDTFGTRGDSITMKVLLNDTDPDLDRLFVAAVGDVGDAGTVQVLPGGDVITFTPSESFTGSTTVDYTVSDGVHEDRARVEIVRRSDADNADPVATRDIGRIEAGRSLDIDVLANDYDPDGDTLTIDRDALLIESERIGATLDVDRQHLVIEAPATPGGLEVEYVVLDGQGGSSTQTVVVEVLPEGQDAPPFALPDIAFARAGVAFEIRPLDNDTDPNLDPITLRIVDDGGYQVGEPTEDGVLTVVADGDGRIIYEAFANGEASRPVAIRVKIVDDGVNHPPVAVRDEITVTAGLPSSLNIVDVLANDVDPDRDALTARLLPDTIEPSIGVEALGGGLFEIEVLDPTDTFARFRYRVDDGHGGQSDSSVAITILPPPKENLPPIANPDEVTLHAGDVRTLDLLTNDDDPERAVKVLVSLAGQPDWVVATTEGVVLSPPVDAEAATVGFTYVMSDGELTDEAEVTITLLAFDAPNSPPDALDDLATAAWDTPVTIDVLSNDDDPDGDPLQVESVSGGQFGSLEIVGDDVRYIPFGNLIEPATDTFTYTVGDGEATDEGRVSVRLERPATINEAPVARDDDARATVGVAVLIPVQDNDADPDGEPIEFAGEPTAGDGFTTRAVGDAIEFTAQQSGRVQFTYSVTDPLGQTDTADVVVEVVEATLPPDAVDDTTDALRPGESATWDVLRNDRHSDTDTVTFADPAITVRNGLATFTVPASTTTYAYTITDREGREDTAALTVRVIANRAPVRLEAARAGVETGGTVSIALTEQVVDPDRDPLTFALVGSAQLGDATISGDIARFTAGSQPGVGSMVVRVSDGTYAIEITVPVDVRGPANRPPTLRGLQAITLLAGDSTTVDLAQLVIDPENDLSTMRYSASTSGSLTTSVQGSTLVITASSGATAGTGVVSFTVTDGDLAPVTGTIDVIVQVPVVVPQLVGDGPFVAPTNATSFTTPDLVGNDQLFGGTLNDVQGLNDTTVRLQGTTAVVDAPGAGWGQASFAYRVRDTSGVLHTSEVVTVTFRSDPGLVTLVETSPGVLDLSTYDARGGQFVRFEIRVDGGAPTNQTSTTFTVPGNPGTTHQVEVRLVTDVGTGLPNSRSVTIAARLQDPPVTSFLQMADVNIALINVSAPVSNGATLLGYRFTVNGVQGPLNTTYPLDRATVVNLTVEPGQTNTVIVSLVSELGEAPSAPISFAVNPIPNRPPVVTGGFVVGFSVGSPLAATDFIGNSGPLPSRCCDLSAAATDVDGTVVRLYCYLDGLGAECGNMAPLIEFLRNRAYTMTLRAYDDDGDYSEATFTFIPAWFPVLTSATCSVSGVVDGPLGDKTVTVTVTTPFIPFGATAPLPTTQYTVQVSEAAPSAQISHDLTASATISGRSIITPGPTLAFTVNNTMTVGSACL